MTILGVCCVAVAAMATFTVPIISEMVYWVRYRRKKRAEEKVLQKPKVDPDYALALMSLDREFPGAESEPDEDDLEQYYQRV